MKKVMILRMQLSSRVMLWLIGCLVMGLLPLRAMSHVTGRACDMAVVPHTNVNLATNVRDILNAAGGNVGDTLASFFSASAKISHWSFRKPYKTSLDKFKLTDVQIRSINCGFTLKSLTAYSQVPSAMDGNMNGWAYNLPTGGESSPYRLGDFCGYKTDATPMIQEFYVPPTASKQFEGASVKATAIVNQQDGVSVSLADIGSLTNGYASVYLVQSGGTGTRMYKAGSALSGGTFDVDVPITDLATGDWLVYPFITLGNTYYTIPNVKERTLNIVTSNYTIAVLVTRRLDGKKDVSYTISITNSASSAATWTNNTYKLRFSGKSFEDSLVTGEKSGSLTSPITIAGNATTKLTGTISDISEALWNSTMELWVSFNSGAQIGSGIASVNSQT